MTEKQVFEAVLIEVDKVGAPIFDLRTFNYTADVAYSAFVDEVYLAFENTQKSLDYISGLKRSRQWKNSSVFGNNPIIDATAGFYKNSYRVSLEPLIKGLPEGESNLSRYGVDDYRHCTGVFVEYVTREPIPDRCYPSGSVFEQGAKRLDSDTYASIIADPFQKPRYFRPYWLINTVNTSTPGSAGAYPHLNILIGPHEYVDSSNNTVKALDISVIKMDYLKNPRKFSLTHTQAYSDVTDTSLELEVSDIAALELIQKTSTLLLERFGSQRTVSQAQVNQPMPRPDLGVGGGQVANPS